MFWWEYFGTHDILIVLTDKVLSKDFLVNSAKHLIVRIIYFYTIKNLFLPSQLSTQFFDTYLFVIFSVNVSVTVSIWLNGLNQNKKIDHQLNAQIEKFWDIFTNLRDFVLICFKEKILIFKIAQILRFH